VRAARRGDVTVQEPEQRAQLRLDAAGAERARCTVGRRGADLRGATRGGQLGEDLVDLRLDRGRGVRGAIGPGGATGVVDRGGGVAIRRAECVASAGT
jgi:hypothetical protein